MINSAASRRTVSMMVLLATLLTLMVVLVRPAESYTCNVTARNPVNSNQKVSSRTEASCPAATELKTLKSSVVRLTTLLPDVTVATSQYTVQSTYMSRTASGCDKSGGGTHAYKTVGNLTAQGNTTSGTANLICV